jgi:chemotaxis protein MotB
MRRKKVEEHENHERWLVSYADFITLLFAFFTTLYAISTVDAQKVGKLAVSARESFHNNLFSPGSREMSLNPGAGNYQSSREVLKSIDLRGTRTKDDAILKAGSKRQLLSGEKELGRLKKEIETILSAEVQKGILHMQVEARGLVISLGEAGMYDSGSDMIKPEGKPMLDTIASSLAVLDNEIRVEGHTDNVPIRNSRFPSNWELSTARATGMLRYLVEKFSFRPEALSAGGYAEFRPAATNDTAEGRTRNRLVDIIVLNPAAARIEPK